MKRLFVLLIASVVTLMSFAGISFAGEAEKEDDRDFMNYLFELSDDMSDEDYCWTVEKNFRIIKNFQLLFTEDSYKAFNKAHKVNNRENAEKCNAALELLVPVRSVADAVWFLWDKDNMPMADEDLQPGQVDAESELDYDGFIPFVIKFLQEDQSQVKGNILMCSGGGFHYRSNAGEAYKVMPIFYEMGYNVFILQRRIAPFCAEDIFMDMQRAIRMIRYYGEKENYGGLDMVATMGWSGGGGTIMGTLQTAYGDISPADLSLTEYVPDEIDAISADFDVAVMIYSAFKVLDEAPEETGGFQSYVVKKEVNNPNLPAFYICTGELDNTGRYEDSLALYDLLKDQTDCKLTVMTGAGHGFGIGQDSAAHITDECKNLLPESDEFMQSHLGYTERENDETEDAETENTEAAESGTAAIYFPDAPEEFVKAKAFYGYYILMDTDVIFALNEDETRFAVQFYGMGGKMPTFIMGNVYPDGTVEADSNFIGLYGEDLQTMYEDALEEEADWAPITR